MARIRTIKPEFWQDEDLAEISEPALLLAASLLNHADDEGYFRANPGLIKAACFPLREPSATIPGALRELVKIGYIRLFDGTNGKSYGNIVGFTKHQKVSKPTASKIKHLEPPPGILPESSRNPPGILPVGKEQGTGNREQGKDSNPNGLLVADGSADDPPPDCPHQQIIDLYHKHCPTMPRVVDWHENRQKLLRARWRQRREHQDVGWWEKYLEHCNDSEFLRGDKNNFCADLEWLVRPTNFAKVIEGKYHREVHAV